MPAGVPMKTKEQNKNSDYMNNIFCCFMSLTLKLQCCAKKFEKN